MRFAIQSKFSIAPRKPIQVHLWHWVELVFWKLSWGPFLESPGNLCADQIETSTSPPPPPPRANPGHLTIFCSRGVGNLTDKAFPGVGNLTLPGWGGENWTGSVRFQIFVFFRAPKSLTAINTCLDEMEEFEGRDIAFVSDWLTKKGLPKWDRLNINDFCRLYIKDVDFLYNESRCGFVSRLCLQRFLE